MNPKPTKTMLEIKVKRNPAESGEGYTHARLSTGEGGFLSWTLEDTDRGLTQDMDEAKIKAIKVYGKTAIPTGRYRIRLCVSPTLKDRSYAKPYGGKFPVLENVPGFSGVMIHPGNTTDDTRGCILPGMLMGEKRGRIYDSQKAYKDLMDFYIWPAYKRGDEIWITIE